MEWIAAHWLQLVSAIVAAIGWLGRRSIWSRIRSLKQGLFDIGAMEIRLEAAEADNRALTEALRRCRAANALLSDVCDASPIGSIASSTATSETAPNASPPTPS